MIYKVEYTSKARDGLKNLPLDIEYGRLLIMLIEVG